MFFLNGAKPARRRPRPSASARAPGRRDRQPGDLGTVRARRSPVCRPAGRPDQHLHRQAQRPNSYAVTATEKITAVKAIPNHNDNGAVNTGVTDRQVTGILVTGTATSPVLYATSSDPRIGGGATGTDTNLDTNSGMISRLTWNGTSWQKQDLVRGLPRSEENHSPNGIQLDPVTNTLYVAVGGFTNQGAPSNNFALLPEYALSAAILKVDLGAIGSGTYDLPTLDDETRAGTTDAGDPFGGTTPRTRPSWCPTARCRSTRPGSATPMTSSSPRAGACTPSTTAPTPAGATCPSRRGRRDLHQRGQRARGDRQRQPALRHRDRLLRRAPNPTRGNKANTFNTSNPQSPVATANPVECDYRQPGPRTVP